MRSDKTIGILGGMGPEATLYCFEKIIQATPAEKDQDHLRIVIDSNPKVPDRTAAILGKGPSPVQMLVKGCINLERIGADFIIIPCVSAHYYISELREQVSLPLLSIFDTVCEDIERMRPPINIVGLMGTTGTIKGGLFQKRLSESGISTIVCDEAEQTRVMSAIYEIKKGNEQDSRRKARDILVQVAEGLIRQGARAIIAGCTEIPLVLEQRYFNVPYFDVVESLAKAAVKRALG